MRLFGISRTSKVAPKLCAAAAVAVAVTMTGGTTALAASAGTTAAPAVSVTPASNLEDGASVTATLSGFGAAKDVVVGQCAGTPGTASLVCDVSGMAGVTTGTDGGGQATVVVHRAFQGVDQNGTSVDVDCATVPGGCFIGATDADQLNATAPISFK